MATRVTPAEVKAIVATTLADPIVQTWIDAANAIVNEQSACIGGDEPLLTQVELYLSAHFLALVDPELDRSRVSKEKTEELQTDYNVAKLMGNVNDTVYGTTANMLAKGCLTNVNQAPATVEFF